MKNYVRKAYDTGYRAGIAHVQTHIPIPKGASEKRAVRTINAYFDGYRDAYTHTHPKFRMKGLPLWRKHAKK